MRLRSQKQSAHYVLEAIHFPWFKRLFSYITILFFICLGDAMLTYYSPVYVESLVHNELLMGFIIASSSAIGLLCDILFGEWFSGKPHRFFLRWGLVIYFLFPLSFIVLPPHPIFLFVSMALWGMCYEFGLFSDFHFINESLDHPHHSIAWSTIKTFSATAYMLGPMLASFFIERSPKLTPVIALIFIILAALLYLLLGHSVDKRGVMPEIPVKKHSITHEFQIWSTLLPQLWPIILFVFTSTIVDSVFWTIGALLSESLKELHPFGGFLLTIYVVPSLFSGFIGARLSPILGKKRTAFVSGALGGIAFVLAGLSEDVMSLLLFIFIAAFFQGIATPLIYATIEDYIERLGHSANALVGLENSTTSLSYIIGPILGGAIASNLGDRSTFTIVGSMFVFVSLLALTIVPRKIHLPQQKIAVIDAVRG